MQCCLPSPGLNRVSIIIKGKILGKLLMTTLEKQTQIENDERIYRRLKIWISECHFTQVTV